MTAQAIPGGAAELEGVAGQPHLMRLTFPVGATGYLTIDVDGVPLPELDLAAVALADTQVLLPVENHADRSIGLTFRAG